MARVLDDLWRYDQYIKDAKKGKHKECVKLWEQISKQDSKQVAQMRKLIAAKVKAGQFQ